MNIPNGVVESIDKKVRNIINRFVKEQNLQKSFIYASVRNGVLWVSWMNDSNAAYSIHHIYSLISRTDGRDILDDYLNMKRKVEQHLSVIDFIEKALNQLYKHMLMI
jgi:hypothetical protein